MSKNSYFGAKKRTGYKGRGNNNNQNRSRGGSNKSARGKQYINPARFVNKATTPTETVVEQVDAKFADFGFNHQINENLNEIGFDTPSPIQAHCIPIVMTGRDVLGLANTGTGKTAAFLLPTINAIFRDRKPFSVLIMAPTRELAQQIDEEFKNFSRGMKLFSAVCVGGVNIDRQIRELNRRPHVVIGTPGRLKDLLERKKLSLGNVTTFILDEADRMLDMGFVNDIEKIASQITSDHQTLCFSATINDRVQKLLSDYMKYDYKTISVVQAETNNHIEQDILHAGNKEQKMELLKELLAQPEFQKVLIFHETKYGAQRLSDHLTKNNLPSVAIHGNKSQSQRQKALNQFKAENVKVMVATDVAARGLDIDDVTHVINFEQPRTYEDYVHRIGRTGRAGKYGKALTFVDKKPV